jgi:protein TonB
MIFAMMAAAWLAHALDAPKPAMRARANLSEYFSTDDYPETAARRGIEGTTGFRLDIGPDGRVTNCTVTNSSGDPALDSATCSVLLSRAEYSPARDGDGRAIAGTDQGRVTWRLPPPDAAQQPQPFADVHAPVRIDLTVGTDAERRPTCTVLVNGESGHAGGDALCSYVSGSGDADFMANAPANVALTVDVAIGLEDAMPPPAPLDRGTLMIDGTARLTVGADGRVAGCQVIETNFHEGIPAEAMPMDLCAFPSFTEEMFAALPKGSADRTGRIRVEMHVRVGPPTQRLRRPLEIRLVVMLGRQDHLHPFAQQRAKARA